MHFITYFLFGGALYDIFPFRGVPLILHFMLRDYLLLHISSSGRGPRAKLWILFDISNNRIIRIIFEMSLLHISFSGGTFYYTFPPRGCVLLYISLKGGIFYYIFPFRGYLLLHISSSGVPFITYFLFGGAFYHLFPFRRGPRRANSNNIRNFE